MYHWLVDKSALRNKYGITEQDEKEFPLPEEKDYAILSAVKLLESKDLSEDDRDMVSLIKTQILDDWRDPLLERLKELTKKYS